MFLKKLVSGPTLFNTLIGNVDSGTECSHSKFADDTKLCSVADTLDERNVLQSHFDS